MNQIMQGQSLTIFGDGEQTRAFSYVADVAPVIAESPLVPEARHEIFNVGADEPYTVNELARAVCQAMGVEVSVEHLPPRNEVVHAYADHTKLRRVFGERESVALEDGLRRMAEWAKAVGTKACKEFGEIEIRQNLPPSWAEGAPSIEADLAERIQKRQA